VTDQGTLRGLVEGLGVGRDEIDRAEADGTLGLLAMANLVFPDEPRYTQTEMIGRTKLGEQARAFWRALGFADPPPEEAYFTDDDLEMLHALEELLETGVVDPEVALQMTRVVGSSMARVASAMIDAVEERVDATETDDGGTGDDTALARAGTVLPMFPKVLEYTWRRHLQAAARRRLVLDASAQANGAAGVSVGFADLVGFTALSQQLNEHELADVVGRFEALAYDVVAQLGGRVVKMIGDEVMFTVADPASAVEIALSLAEAYHDDESLSDVRVGVAHGPVLEKEGDLYGPTVNLASRIVGIAFAASVVVSDDVHTALADDDRLVWKSLRTRQLKDIGRVRLWVVRRADDPFTREAVRDRARRRRATIRDRLADLLPSGDDDDRSEEEE
jgi:adenylate cyclase